MFLLEIILFVGFVGFVSVLVKGFKMFKNIENENQIAYKVLKTIKQKLL